MKIYNSKNGSINCFYKSILIASVGTNDFYTIDYYKYAANRLLIEGMEHGNNFQDLKKQFLNFIKRVRYEKIIKKNIDKEDRETILITFLILCKLKIIDEDGDREGILICGRKKPKRVIETHPCQP